MRLASDSSTPEWRGRRAFGTGGQSVPYRKLVGEIVLVRNQNHALEGLCSLKTFQLVGHCPEPILIQTTETFIDNYRLQWPRSSTGKSTDGKGDGHRDPKLLTSGQEQNPDRQRVTSPPNTKGERLIVSTGRFVILLKGKVTAGQILEGIVRQGNNLLFGVADKFSL